MCGFVQHQGLVVVLWPIQQQPNPNGDASVLGPIILRLDSQCSLIYLKVQLLVPALWYNACDFFQMLQFLPHQFHSFLKKNGVYLFLKYYPKCMNTQVIL